MNGAYLDAFLYPDSVLLAPGDYVLAPESTGVLPRAFEQAVTVVFGRITAVEIVFDSGIR